ncbi:MAG TPA: PEP-CTERM sorting domain-containing protein [Rhodanobacteraceae bacterium]|jgi:hypothetical protein|nr:PEP-CTERM sorting domain-containing protein [Rhodanobacteraceae bacterium]
MRNSLLVSAALASGALLFSVGAKAVPIHVGIQAAGGSQVWTSGPIEDPSFVTLSAWEDDGNGWYGVYMTNGQDALGNPGLGVCGSQPGGANSCAVPGETNEIDRLPQQMIELNITEFHNWNSVTITLLSVEQDPFAGLWGASCSLLDPNCTPTLTALEPTCSGPDANGIVSCTYSETYLESLDIDAIWIQPQFDCGRNCGRNFYLGAGDEFGLVLDLNPESVPEPSVLGMFGLGTLLLGLFAGLRRRRTS